MKRLWVGLLLALIGLAGGETRQAMAATANWAEEMNALPGANWGAWDDFDGRMKNDITLVDVNGNPGTGAWKRPLGGSGAGSYGMAYIDPGSGLPLNTLPSMAGPAAAQYTAEIRYKIITPLPSSLSGPASADAMWFNVGGGWASGDSGADIRMFEGIYGEPGSNTYYTDVSGEGFQGSNPGIFNAPSSAFSGTTRGEWHTLRLIQDEVGNTQKVYIDGALISTQDTSGYNRGFTFTRGLAFGAYNVDNNIPIPEVHYDYIRLANGIVPIGESINAVPEPAAGLLTLLMAGLGCGARRRQA